MYLQNASPGLNGGENTGIHITDIAGNARIIANTVDMGVYENSNTVSIDEKLKSNKMNIYPNPTNSILMVEANDFEVINLYNSLGQNMNDRVNFSDKIHGKIIIDCSELANGIYMQNIGN